ncbi:hypothetical protein NVS55_06170 [Myxococcus stipitatus]|uniref:hypothetical protein n=1 Tax=Myxococcus stipitatus TaxID=83455 RepID=UPI0031455518
MSGTAYADDANRLLTGVDAAVKREFERDVFGNSLVERLDGRKRTPEGPERVVTWLESLGVRITEVCSRG